MGPDIVAGTAAIEYETGLKDIRSTESMIAARKNGCSNVLIITNRESKHLYAGMCQTLSINEFMVMDGKELNSIMRLTQLPEAQKTI